MTQEEGMLHYEAGHYESPYRGKPLAVFSREDMADEEEKP